MGSKVSKADGNTGDRPQRRNRKGLQRVVPDRFTLVVPDYPSRTSNV